MTGDELLERYKNGERLFKEVDLTGVDLYDSRLPDIDLSGSCLNGANLENSEMWDARLDGCSIIGANLSGVNMERASLCGAKLKGSILCGANLGEAIIRGTDLRKSDLKGTIFSQAILRMSCMRGADLRGADMGWADLDGAILWESNLRGALINPAKILLAEWGEVSKGLCTELMRYDCANHPFGFDSFDKWSKGGDCPYVSGNICRVANFKQKMTLWSPGPAKSALELMIMLVKEKCKDSDWHEGDK